MDCLLENLLLICARTCKLPSFNLAKCWAMDKKNIKNLIKKNRVKIKCLGVVKIGLFGSYTRGEQTEGSDIDILIQFNPEEENFDNFMSLYDLLEEIFQQNEIDVVTANGLSPYIGPKILKEVEYVEIND